MRRALPFIALLSCVLVSCLLPTTPSVSTTKPTPPGSTGLLKSFSCVPLTPNPAAEVKTCYVCRLSENTQEGRYIIPVVNKSSHDITMTSVNAVNFCGASGQTIFNGAVVLAMVEGAKRKHYDQTNNWVPLATILPGDTGYVLSSLPVAYDSIASVTARSVSYDTSGIPLASFGSNVVYTGYYMSGTMLVANIQNTGSSQGIVASSWAMLLDNSDRPCAYLLLMPDSSVLGTRQFDTLQPGATAKLYASGSPFSGQFANAMGFIYYCDHYGNN
jgi:hypothetical protein